MELAADALLDLADVVHDEGMEEAELDHTFQASTGETRGDASTSLPSLHNSRPAPSHLDESASPFEADDLEREIATLLNQDASHTADTALLTDPDHSLSTQRADDASGTAAQPGMNLAGLSAMIHTAQAQQTSPDAPPQLNTRSAPSFHSLTAATLGSARPDSHRSYDPLADDEDVPDSLSSPPRKRQRREQSASESTDYFASDGALSGADNEDEWNDFALQLSYQDADGDAPPSTTPTMHMDDGLLDMHLFDPRFQTDLSEEDDDISPIISSVRPQHQPPPSRPETRSSPHPLARETTPAVEETEPPIVDAEESVRRIKKPKDANGYHVCEYEHCDKSFKRRSDMLRHMRIHSGDRPYLCTHPGCGKSFIQRSALSVHARVHTGEKPHTCEYPHCGKLFADSSSLARHRRTHTGSRPFKCEEPGCDKEFTRRGNLNSHLRTHDPNYEPEPDVKYDATGKKKRKRSVANEDDESGEEDNKLLESVRTLSALLTGDERGISSIGAELAAAIAEARREPSQPTTIAPATDYQQGQPPTVYEIEDDEEESDGNNPAPLRSGPKALGIRQATQNRTGSLRRRRTSTLDDDGDGEEDDDEGGGSTDANSFPTPLRTRRTAAS